MRKGSQPPELPMPRLPPGGGGGSVLILTVWTLMVLSVLALVVGLHVSANIRVAQYLRDQTTAYYLARGGVELAVAEIHRRFDEKAPTTSPEPVITGDDADANPFVDNASLAKGTFSVWCITNSPDPNCATGRVYGVRQEKNKINLDLWRGGADVDPEDATFKALACALTAIGRGGSDPQALAAEILSGYPKRKYPVAEGAVQDSVASGYLRDYGAYEALPELFLAVGMDADLFEELEPLVTIEEFAETWTSGSGGVPESRTPCGLEWAYGGVAEGRAVAEDERGSTTTAVRRITFVYSPEMTKFLYWREH